MLTIYLITSLIIWFLVFWTTACLGDTFSFSFFTGLIIGSMWPIIIILTVLALIIELILYVIKEELNDINDLD